MGIRARVGRHSGAFVVAAMSGAAALVSRAAIFPDGSPNLDELGYLSQAEALRLGHLTLPAATHEPYFMPYLAGVHDHHIVFKYQPLWPAFLALVRAITGSYVPALPSAAGVAALVVYWFGYEITRSRRVALVAAVIYALSPFTVLESGTFLAYTTSTVLLCATAALVLRARRLDSVRLLAAAGLALGIACFHRTYDGVLWGVILVPLALLPRPSGAPSLVRRLGAIVAGGLPALGLYLLYNLAVMGSPLTPAFTASGSSDTFGFGQRASFRVGSGGELHFTPAVSLRGMQSYAYSLGSLSFGSWALLGLCAVALVRCRSNRYVGLTVALIVSVPIGYFFWWGLPNSVDFRLQRLVGPFYWLPALPPLALLAAQGLEHLGTLLAPRRDAPPGALKRLAPLAVLAVVTVALAPSTLDAPRASGRDRSAEVALQRVPGARTLLFSPPQFPGDPYVRAVVPGDLPSAAHLIAVDVAGGRRRLDLLRAQPGREAYVITRVHAPEGIFDPPVSTLRRVTVHRATTLTVRVEVRASFPWKVAEIYVRYAGRPTRTIRRWTDVAAGQHLVASTTIGGPGRGTPAPTARDPHLLAVGVRLANGPSAASGRSAYECAWESATGNGEVALVDPPVTRHLYVFGAGKQAWSVEDVSPVLSCTIG